jgi:isopentenyl diphosphate isomerase/L-lactate dehydrogenase-like FMN-dependent dehydrogenase
MHGVATATMCAKFGLECVVFMGAIDVARQQPNVLRMRALGADGVLLGRAWAYALAAGGRRSVEALIDTLGRELKAAMAMAGRTSLAELDPSVLDV